MDYNYATIVIPKTKQPIKTAKPKLSTTVDELHNYFSYKHRFEIYLLVIFSCCSVLDPGGIMTTAPI